MEILATEVVSKMHGWGFFFLISGFLVLGLGLTLLNLAKTEMGMALGAGVAIIGIIISVFISNVDAKEFNQHTVIIHDYAEVRENGFEIVEEKGKLTIVREREAE